MPKIVLDPGFWTKTSWIQLFYGVWVNFTSLSIGLAFGFPAVQVPQLSQDSSEVKITRSDASWIASVMILCSPIGCLLSGYVIDRFGRRTMIIACQAPICLAWVYTGLAPSAFHIIIARSFTGIACGIAMGPPRIYSTEIALPNMRGMIGTFPSLFLALGVCIQAGLGIFVHWRFLCYTCAAFAFINLIAYNFLPESPYFLLTKDASVGLIKKNLGKFRGPSYDLDAELGQLMEFKNDNKIRKLTFIENMERLFTKQSCRPFMVVNTYILISQLSGTNVVLMWGVEILGEAKSSFDIDTGLFMLTVTTLVVVAASSIMLFRVGRRRMSLISACGVCIVCFSLGAFILYNTQASIVPQLSFMAYMFFVSIGFYTIPYLLMAELYPLQVRGTLSGITVSASSFMVFGCIKLYPFVRDSIGLGNTVIAFGANALLGALFLYYFLPETKDLTLQEIEEYYNETRPTLTSQRRLQTLQSMQSSPPPLRIQRSRSSIEKEEDLYYRQESKRKISAIKKLMNRPSQIVFGGHDKPLEEEPSLRELIRRQMMQRPRVDTKDQKKKPEPKEKKKKRAEKTEEEIEEEKKRIRRMRSASLKEVKKEGAMRSADMEGSEESTDDESSARKKGTDDSQPSTSKQGR